MTDRPTDPLFLDTNPIIRFITNDNPDQSARARALFRDVARGIQILHTSEAVIAEAVFVLSSPSLYRLPRPEIAQQLATIIRLPGLRLPNKRTYLRVLDLYVAY